MKANMIGAALGVLLIAIISFNSVRTKTNTEEIVKVEVVEIIKEVPVEVVVEKYISECKSFEEAFNVHRELLGKHKTFYWNGKEYNLYYKEEIKWEQ